MSLFKQIGLWVSLALCLMAAAGWSAAQHTAQQQVVARMAVQNQAAAQLLASALNDWLDQPEMVKRLLSERFRAGDLTHLRWVDASGQERFLQQTPARPTRVPSWATTVSEADVAVGVGRLGSPGQHQGQVELYTDLAEAVSDLWLDVRHAALTLLGWLLLALAVLAWGLSRVRRQITDTVEQATALADRRFELLKPPRTPELSQLVRAMNLMIERMKAMFDEQVQLVDVLRRQANHDALTGLSNRAHFMGRLKVMLGAEDGSAAGVLVLVRINDLNSVNRRLGRVRTDAMLVDLAHTMVEAAQSTPLHETGRLNGSDFALILPGADHLQDTATALGQRLRTALSIYGPDCTAVVAAVPWVHGSTLSSLLALADQALAQAEARGPFAVEVDHRSGDTVLGEDAWRRRIGHALHSKRARLVEFPVVNSRGQLLHRECSLRLQLDEDDDMVPAAQWLPMARRTHLTAPIDLLATSMALRAMAQDGVPRAVNISPASLADNRFTAELRALLTRHAEVAAGLLLELPESGALRHSLLVRELVAMAHAHGAQVGLEHAGEELSEARALLESGLDFVKLDPSLTEGLAHDAARIQHVAGTVRMLRRIGLKVHAEGVMDKEDARTLWKCELDGMTGPVVSRLDNSPPGVA